MSKFLHFIIPTNPIKIPSDQNKIPPDCEANNICVDLRQLDERVGELAELADELDQVFYR